MHFGPAEVLGYLGVWAQCADDFQCRRTHVQNCEPKLADIRSYLTKYDAFTVELPVT